MRIEVLYFKGCPNHEPAVSQIQSALTAEGIEAFVEEVEVLDAATAQEKGFLGSPSIRVDGLDIEPAARNQQAFGFGCRSYSDSEGRRSGLPTLALIRQALIEASTPGAGARALANEVF